MKFKSAAQRSAVIIVILILSVLIGYIYQSIGHRIDLNNHPREYNEYVTKYSAEYGVPEYLIYAIILTESGFQSNFVSENGEIGLMQISPETFEWMLSITKEGLETGILYDPETNIRYGTYLLSYWFTEYSRWDTVIAMYLAGEARVTEWMSDAENVDPMGNLINIPDEDIAEKAAEIDEKMNMYQKLYYNK